MSKLELSFEVAGGRYEPDGSVNYKFATEVASAEEALTLYERVKGYPYNYLRAITSQCGIRKEVTLFGDNTDEEIAVFRLKMDVSHLWMITTGEHFADLRADPCEQVDEVLTRVIAMKEGA